jgi:hypothetical protein
MDNRNNGTSIIARSLTIVDEEGKPRICLTTEKFSDMQDVTKIEFLNQSGETRLGLQLVNDDVRIFICPTQSSPGLEIRVDELACGLGIGGRSGEGPVVFLGHNPDPEKSNSPFRKGQGYLFIRDVSTGEQFNIPEPD